MDTIRSFEQKIKALDAALNRLSLLDQDKECELQTLRKEIKTWQVDVMGNTCTICYGDNVWDKCSVCGWWGKVQPRMDRLKEE